MVGETDIDSPVDETISSLSTSFYGSGSWCGVECYALWSQRAYFVHRESQLEFNCPAVEVYAGGKQLAGVGTTCHDHGLCQTQLIWWEHRLALPSSKYRDVRRSGGNGRRACDSLEFQSPLRHNAISSSGIRGPGPLSSPPWV